ncbi:protein ENHANCED DISEASE RESISTANCE 2-like isoform X2 [Senna tora]|uniref:Protein ENHANCED DISEASE RESISTANCE 2-like isoform X2 n=1 Tax=Senna tora TaxID=362788 RepID=A0A834X6E9_9FABA|nr:protein ENHANCED DISEASE RESISTANCE 2-like isoform X2 [Senna tora]
MDGCPYSLKENISYDDNRKILAIGILNGKGVLAKSVGYIDATAETVFEVLLNTEQQQRYEWDMLMGDLELVDSYDGHYDVVYGTYDPKYLTRNLFSQTSETSYGIRASIVPLNPKSHLFQSWTLCALQKYSSNNDTLQSLGSNLCL